MQSIAFRGARCQIFTELYSAKRLTLFQGRNQLRDYLEQITWNKQPPVPSLPDEVVMRTREKYIEAFRRLTGRELE